jgi:hypothetical protein
VDIPLTTVQARRVYVLVGTKSKARMTTLEDDPATLVTFRETIFTGAAVLQRFRWRALCKVVLIETILTEPTLPLVFRELETEARKACVVGHKIAFATEIVGAFRAAKPVDFVVCLFRGRKHAHLTHRVHQFSRWWLGRLAATEQLGCIEQQAGGVGHSIRCQCGGLAFFTISLGSLNSCLGNTSRKGEHAFWASD